MTPLVSAVWSCDPGSALKYPARYLFSFLDHHGMLSVTGSPTWRTVTGGSGEYVRLVAKSIGDIRLNTPVRAIHRFDDRVDIRDGDDQIQSFELECNAMPIPVALINWWGGLDAALTQASWLRDQLISAWDREISLGGELP